MLGNVIAGDDCNRSSDRSLDSCPLNSLSNPGLSMIRRWLDRLTFVAAKRGVDIWKRDDLPSRREVGRYQARIDATKNANGAHRLLQRRDAQSAAQACAQPQGIWPDCVPLAVPIGLLSPAIRTSTVAIAARSKRDVWCRKATSAAR
jgi:hypothetical protein